MRKAINLVSATMAIILLACVALLFTGARQDTSARPLTRKDFDIYYSGAHLLNVSDALRGSFWYSYAESYNLVPETLETRRGISLYSPATSIASAYAGQQVDIEILAGQTQTTYTLKDLNTWLAASYYSSNYTATFYAYEVNGRFTTDPNTLDKATYTQSIRIYLLAFHVRNGLVYDIECDTHMLNAAVAFSG